MQIIFVYNSIIGSVLSDNSLPYFSNNPYFCRRNKTDRYEPFINRILEDMGNHYGTVVVPARLRHPKDKSRVEGSVRLVYMRVFAELRNEMFRSLEELNAAAADKMRKHNQKRMQKNPYTREERFLAVDRPNLKPLPPPY